MLAWQLCDVQGIQPNIAKKFYIFEFFSERSGPRPPSGSALGNLCLNPPKKRFVATSTGPGGFIVMCFCEREHRRLNRSVSGLKYL